MRAAARAVEAALEAAGDAAYAVTVQGYFKTGPGEYGEGDRFLGLRMPAVRRFVRTHADLPPADVLDLLDSGFHEARMLAVLLLVQHYEKGDAKARQRVYDAYLSRTHRVNNWDLVDLSAPRIVGPHLDVLDASPLPDLARSAWLWDRRIAILATHHRIRDGRFDDTLAIAAMLLDDRHDLIHKATGWMLREVGNRDRAVAEAFLRRHLSDMPRTMLRYAIETYPPALRQRYLRGDV